MLKTLEWDSNFLSKKVGMMQVCDEEFIPTPEMEAYDLLYVFSPTELTFPAAFAGHFSVQLVDEKLTFHKSVSHMEKPDAAIFSLPADYIPDVHFEELAIQSGVRSRFSVDERFPDEKFRELYRLWLQRSVNRSLADEVLVWQSDDTIAGFITLKMRSVFAEIGLVAVDHQFRGRGIADKLMAAADAAVMKDGRCNEIRVVTQGANKPACGLYIKSSYTILSRQFVYHCWKQHNV